MDNDQTRDQAREELVERLTELLVYGPIGFAAYLRDTAPSFAQLFVSRGRGEIERRRRAHDAPANPTSTAATPASGNEHPASPPSDSSESSEARVLRLAPTPEDFLAIHDYDELSAAQVVDRLEALQHDELESIRHYELRNRGRSTILGKIEQLTRPA